MIKGQSGKLDLRGTKKEYLNKLSAMELLLIMEELNTTIRDKKQFLASELADGKWKGVFAPLAKVAEDDDEAAKLLGVIVKQMVIISPYTFEQGTQEVGWEKREVSCYKRTK